MRRRDFLASVSAAIAFGPSAAVGQAAAVHSVHIGFLVSASAPRYSSEVEAFKSGLRDLGYVEGKNLLIDFRWAEGNYARLPELARELADLKVDVLVAHGTPGALAAEKATTMIPIVMAITGDPVATGIVSNIRQPDRNITGSTFFAPELAANRIELIKQAIPKLATVGILINPDNSTM
jgi:putative ABC transport system substrate-binding protein